MGQENAFNMNGKIEERVLKQNSFLHSSLSGLIWMFMASTHGCGYSVA